MSWIVRILAVWDDIAWRDDANALRRMLLLSPCITTGWALIRKPVSNGHDYLARAEIKVVRSSWSFASRIRHSSFVLRHSPSSLAPNPSLLAPPVAAQKHKERSEKGWLGVYIQDITRDIKEAMDLKSERGI